MSTPAPPANSLPRLIGPWIAAAIVVGTVIGSGVFKKARNVSENVPEVGLGLLAWVLVGVLTLFGALALAEVAVLLPRAGGNYVYLREAYGRRFGFLWGWVDFCIIRTASIAALATMFAESLHDILKQSLYPGGGGEVLSFWPRQVLTVGVIAGLAAVNIRGTRIGGGLQVLLTAVKVGSLIGIALLPLLVLAVVNAPAHPPRVEHLLPLWPADWSTVNWSLFGAALVGVLWAYHGWMNIGPVAEEVTHPQRNIPLALLGGVVVLILLYVSVNLAYYLVIPHSEMASLPSNQTVATVYCYRLLGDAGVVLASAAIMCSVFGSLNGNILVGPRLLFAMGRDGQAPEGLMRLHPRYQTPAAATAVYAGWSCLLVLGVGALTRYQFPPLDVGWRTLDVNLPAGPSAFDALTDFAMFGAVAFETLAVAAVFVFRWTRPDAERPYRCLGYPVVPAVYVLVMAAVFVNMFATPEQRGVAVIGLAFILSGAVVYQLVLARRGVR